MEISEFKPSQIQTVVALFKNTFSDSEGETEGQNLGSLVQNLITTTVDDDLTGFCATEGEEILACVFFSRFVVPGAIVTCLLSPMAVATRHQQKGIGQTLIRFGLEQLKARGVALVVTYGDPAFYARVGFERVSQQQIQSPYVLSYPDGWLAQSLTSGEIPDIPGETQCVAAFRQQAFW